MRWMIFGLVVVSVGISAYLAAPPIISAYIAHAADGIGAATPPPDHGKPDKFDVNLLDHRAIARRETEAFMRRTEEAMRRSEESRRDAEIAQMLAKRDAYERGQAEMVDASAICRRAVAALLPDGLTVRSVSLGRSSRDGSDDRWVVSGRIGASTAAGRNRPLEYRCMFIAGDLTGAFVEDYTPSHVVPEGN